MKIYKIFYKKRDGSVRVTVAFGLTLARRLMAWELSTVSTERFIRIKIHEPRTVAMKCWMGHNIDAYETMYLAAKARGGTMPYYLVDPRIYVEKVYGLAKYVWFKKEMEQDDEEQRLDALIRRTEQTTK